LAVPERDSPKVFAPAPDGQPAFAADGRFVFNRDETLLAEWSDPLVERSVSRSLVASFFGAKPVLRTSAQRLRRKSGEWRLKFIGDETSNASGVETKGCGMEPMKFRHGGISI
jgi:hypothetical protein